MYALLAALALVVPAPAPQSVTGTVSDPAGNPLADARVTLIELGRTTTTDPEGRFVFTNVAAGAYRLSVSAIGFAPSVRAVTVGDSTITVDVRLKPSVVELTELQVTASPGATTLLDSPQPVSALSGDQLLERQAASLGETVLLPPRRPRVCAVMVESPGLDAVQARVVGALAAAELFEPEERPFLAHVTIARTREKPRRVAVELGADFEIGSVALLESRTPRRSGDRPGVRYTALARTTLRG